jgi:hypothetical protein
MQAAKPVVSEIRRRIFWSLLSREDLVQNAAGAADETGVGACNGRICGCGEACAAVTGAGVSHQSAGWDTELVPTVLRSGPYRVYFYSHEPDEPPHVHVDRDDQSAKFWLKPVVLARNLGFSPVELRRIQGMLKENETILLEKWNEKFGR